MELRNYQKKAMNKALCWFEKETSYPLIVLPTGAGKTVVFVSMIQELYLQDPSKRFLILAHRQELITQAKDKLLSVWPNAPVGILAASLKEFDSTAPIVIASRDTLASKTRLEKSLPFDYIIIDEAHHVGTEKRSRYRKIIDHFEEIGCPKIMGVTATPYRMGQGYIYGMGDHVFGGVAHRAPITQLIKEGFLCRLSAFKVAEDAIIDASKARLKFKNGDYRESDLEQLAMVDQTIIAIVNDWIDKAYTKGRTSTVFFCVSVEHAHKMNRYLLDHGIKSACVTGETPTDEREEILESFEDGKINALCNVAVLTEGWDAPRTDCIALLRPTKSLGLYVQICGRGMRPWGEEKENCMLLDYGGNMLRHGCIDVARPERNKRDEELGNEKPKIWICDECLAVNDMDYKKCIECDASKPAPPPPLQIVESVKETEASETTIAAQGSVLSDEMAGEAPVRERSEPVEWVRAEKAVSKNGNNYLKIMFKSKENYWPYSTALMLNMRGKPAEIARKKWRIMSKNQPYPNDIDVAVNAVNVYGLFKEIKRVNVRKEGKYWNVIGVGF